MELPDPRPLTLEVRAREELTPLVTRVVDGGAPGGSEQVLAALEHLTLPAGRGHAYLSAELAVVRTVGQWLAARGFASADVSPKAYWRAGTANAAHGEPLRDR